MANEKEEQLHGAEVDNAEIALELISIGSLEEGELMLKEYLATHEENETTALATLALAMHSGEMAKCFGEEVISLSEIHFSKAYENREKIASLRQRISENARVRFEKEFLPQFFSLMLSDNAIAPQEKYTFLRVFSDTLPHALSPFLSSGGSLVGSFMPIVTRTDVYDWVKETIEGLYALDKSLYGKEILALGRYALGVGAYDSASEMLNNASYHLDDIAECRFLILCAKLRARGEDEFVKANGFSKTMPEYMALLLALKGKPDLMQKYTALAERNIELHTEKPKVVKAPKPKVVKPPKPKREKKPFTFTLPSIDFKKWKIPAMITGGVALLLCVCLLLPLLFRGGCGVKPENPQGGAENTGDAFEFGEYPQSLKAEGVSIDEGITDERGYFYGSDGEWYAKVVANPVEANYTFSNNSAVTEGEVYYFKVEPIRWRILEERDGQAFILCDSIIANHRYDADSSNYAESEIRAWLNNEFYNTAFTDLQKNMILVATVDNSVSTTGYRNNPYVCDNTEDKIFLLSYAEATNSKYGFSSDDSDFDEARRMLTTDFSRASGASMDTTDYYGCGIWWLRSPNNGYIGSVRDMDMKGFGHRTSYVQVRDRGVVPAMWIMTEPLYVREDNVIYFGEYPQSLKAENVSIDEGITDKRGYFLGSDGEWYAKVVATPAYNNYTFSNSTEVESGEVYYFKVEKIRWRILKEENGNAFLLCDSIIANRRFDSTNNNYATSELRAWLNNEFYTTAFKDIQKQIIHTTKVDNSAQSTGYTTNEFACADTEEKVFLLSFLDIKNSEYSFSTDHYAYDEERKLLTSDYSRATGVYMVNESLHYGVGYWWLRSSSTNANDTQRLVSTDGYGNNCDVVTDTEIGVVPAIWIAL